MASRSGCRDRCLGAGRDERGAALLEFAFALPLLVLLAFGVVDFGRASTLQNKLRNAAREGAGYAQYYPSQTVASCDPVAGDDGDITSKAVNSDITLSSYPNLTVTILKDGVAYSGCNETFVAGDTVTVQISATFVPLTPIASLFIGSGKTLTGSATVQVQAVNG